MSKGHYKSIEIRGEIGQLIAGRKPGRRSGAEVTLLKSVGTAEGDAEQRSLRLVAGTTGVSRAA